MCMPPPISIAIAYIIITPFNRYLILDLFLIFMPEHIYTITKHITVYVHRLTNSLNAVGITSTITDHTAPSVVDSRSLFIVVANLKTLHNKESNIKSITKLIPKKASIYITIYQSPPYTYKQHINY